MGDHQSVGRDDRQVGQRCSLSAVPNVMHGLIEQCVGRGRMRSIVCLSSVVALATAASADTLPVRGRAASRAHSPTFFAASLPERVNLECAVPRN